MSKGLLLAASMAIAVPAIAQGTFSSPDSAAAPAAPAEPEKTVEGATPGRVAQVERCQGHKFESMVETDPVKKRGTRVKLCANPGSSDGEWVKTLEAAIDQIEDRDMPPAARDKLIGELRAEVAKFAPASKPASNGVAIAPRPSVLFGDGPGANGMSIAPAERYETSTLPPLTPKKVTAAGGGAIAAQPKPRMGIRLKCLEPRESGSGSTCDFFVQNTVLAISAVEGLEKGGTLRFLRRGEVHGEAALAPMQAGQLARVKLPGDLCRGISYSKVEIELLGPGSGGAAAARLGPYGLRC